MLILFKFIFKKSKVKENNSIFIIGPSLSGKTSFFYHLLGKPKTDTVMSMQINEIDNYKSPYINKPFDILDIPGTGYYKNFIIDNLARAKLIMLFIDSTDKNSILQTAEYVYDILNSDKYNDDRGFILICNKQDGSFPKTKKTIENELSKEIESLIKIKQKNNLEDNANLGTLFQMKNKFSFKFFNRVQFIETDRTNKYESLITCMRENLAR